VLETTGSSESLAVAAALEVPGLRLLLLGPGDQLLPLTSAAVRRYEVQVVGVGAGHPDLVAEIGALAATGRLPMDDLMAVISPDEMVGPNGLGRAGPEPSPALVVRLTA
jgi:hypothetical protein